MFRKKLSLSCMNKICSSCLALMSFIHFSGVSFLLFGERKFPTPIEH